MSKKIQKLPGKSLRYSKNYAIIQEALQGKTELPLQEAVETLSKFELSNSGAGSSVELHVKLAINPTKSDQTVRSSVTLPHGSGKKTVIAAFVSAENEKVAQAAGADIVGGEELIEKIKKDEKIEFDKAIAEPGMMKNLAQIARLLGVAGVMPNPKNQTVGTDVKGMIEAIKKGKEDYKNDRTGNIHLTCGKLNKEFDVHKLVENIQTALDSIKQAKPDAIKKKFISKVTITTTFGPSITVAV